MDDVMTIDPKYHIRAISVGFPLASTVKIYLEKTLFLQIEDYGLLDTNKERCGILLGSVLGDDTIIIDKVIFLTKAEERSASVRIGPDAVEEYTNIKEEYFPTHRILGWVHTHAGYGVFMSHLDVEVAKTHFQKGLHISMVLDPVNKQVGFYQWKNGTLTESHGFYVYGREGSVKKRELKYKLVYRNKQKTGSVNTPGRKKRKGVLIPTFISLCLLVLISGFMAGWFEYSPLDQTAIRSTPTPPIENQTPVETKSPIETPIDTEEGDASTDKNPENQSEFQEQSPDSMQPVQPEQPTQSEDTEDIQQEPQETQEPQEPLMQNTEEDAKPNIDQEIQTEPEQPTQSEPIYHTVVWNDNLWNLSVKYYGNGKHARAIAAANGIRPHNAPLRVGRVILIPEL